MPCIAHERMPQSEFVGLCWEARMKLSMRGIFALLIAAFACPSALAEGGWSLTQSAKGGAALAGAMTLYITPTGMRTTEPKNGINLMTRGPNWTIYLYNAKT